MQRIKLAIFNFIFISFIIFINNTSAQIYNFKEYTVKKGDTLWDITKQELKDPFLWPKVWHENTEITNPDKIYPHQKIKIPLDLLPQEIVEPKPIIKKEIERPVKPEKLEDKVIVKPTKQIEKEYLVDRNILIKSGYIAESLDYAGEITGAVNGKSLLSTGDYAYIKIKENVNVGDKFYVIKYGEKVKHPETGKHLGYLVEILGVAEVTDGENCSKVKIVESFNEISSGNFLKKFYEVIPPTSTDNPRKPNINGYIIASKHSHLINGTMDVVYLDKGLKDGLAVGDLLATTLKDNCNVPNGLIQVIDAQNTTSTALVKKITNREIIIGDKITKVTQE